MHAADTSEPLTLKVMQPEQVLQVRDLLRVPDGHVHLWALSVDNETSAIGLLEGTLSLKERDRAIRFRLPESRTRFILAHGVMRHLLALYLGCTPCEIEFRADPMGKPELADGGTNISFNLSHSDGRAVLAIGSGQALGVDVEHERTDLDILEMAHYCLTEAERDGVVFALPERRRAEFFRYWVAKESVLKGAGLGLGFPLDKVEIVIGRNSTQATIRSFDLDRLHSDWSLRLLSLGEGWPVAVSGRGESWQVSSPGMDYV